MFICVTAYNDYLLSQNRISSIPGSLSGVRIDSFISSVFSGHPDLLSRLSQISLFFNNFLNISFYTDGSLIAPQSSRASMGLGLVALDSSNSPLSVFKAAAKQFCSSMKAEALSLLSALSVCPVSCVVCIYTDSQGCIDIFNKLFSSSHSLRRHLRLKNFLIWSLIKHVITVRSLGVKLIKVRAHSNNEFNDEADRLAKEGARSGLFLSVNRILPTLPTANLVWTLPDSSKLVVDQNARSIVKNIQQNIQFS